MITSPIVNTANAERIAIKKGLGYDFGVGSKPVSGLLVVFVLILSDSEINSAGKRQDAGLLRPTGYLGQEM